MVSVAATEHQFHVGDGREPGQGQGSVQPGQ